MSVDVIKADARRLAEHLRFKYGWSLKATGALEAIAISRGYKDWNTLAAAHTTPPSAQPGPAVSLPAPTPFQEAQAVSLAELTEAAVAAKASDILLYNQGPELTVHFRVYGLLVFVARLTRDAATPLLTALGAARAEANGEALPGAAYGPFTVLQRAQGEQVMLVWHKVCGTGGLETIVIRVVQNQKRPLPKLDAWSEGVLKAKGGLFLIGGPTGCGKTTSAKLILQHAAERALKVGFLPGPFGEQLSQDAINLPFKNIRSFERTLRDAQEARLDLVVVSELRPEPGMANALVDAANEGLTVLTTMHATSIQGALIQLAQQTAPRDDYAFAVLRGLRLQRLMGRRCQQCQGAGCDACHQRGTKGQVVVSEEVLFSDSLRAQAAARGATWWQPIRTRALELLGAGVVTKDAFERSFGNITVED